MYIYIYTICIYIYIYYFVHSVSFVPRGLGTRVTSSKRKKKSGNPFALRALSFTSSLHVCPYICVWGIFMHICMFLLKQPTICKHSVLILAGAQGSLQSSLEIHRVFILALGMRPRSLVLQDDATFLNSRGSLGTRMTITSSQRDDHAMITHGIDPRDRQRLARRRGQWRRRTTIRSSFTRRCCVHRRNDGASCCCLAELNWVLLSRANSARLPVLPRRRPAPSDYHLGSSSQTAAIASADSAAPINKHISSYSEEVSHLDFSIRQRYQPHLVFLDYLWFSSITIKSEHLILCNQTYYIIKITHDLAIFILKVYKRKYTNCFQLIAFKVIKEIYLKPI